MPTHPSILLLPINLACAPSRAADDGESSSTGGPPLPDGPVPGAPDEKCALDPARVYVMAQDLNNGFHVTLTDVEDRTIACAYDRPFWPGQLDPTDGSLVAIRGRTGMETDLGNLAFVRYQPDWLVQLPSGNWSNRCDRESNDEVLLELGDSEDVQPASFFSDETTVFVEYGERDEDGEATLSIHPPGPTPIPELVGATIGMVGGRRVYFAPATDFSPYAIDTFAGAASTDDVTVLGVPEGWRGRTTGPNEAPPPACSSRPTCCRR